MAKPKVQSVQEQTSAQEQTASDVQEQTASDEVVHVVNGTTLVYGSDTLPYTIDDLPLALPKFRLVNGTLDDNIYLVLFHAVARQFRNNIEAAQKALGKAGKAKLTGEEILAKWQGYLPSVGDTTRQSTMDKIRHDATLRAIVALFKSHNALVLAAPVEQKPTAGLDLFGKFKGKILNVPKDEDKREALIARWLTQEAYASYIQDAVDAIVAEREARSTKAKSKAEIEANEASADDF